MVVEHTFVTTKEAAEVLAAAREFLVGGGFRVEAESESFLELKRGRENLRKIKGPLQLPQQVRIEFDRGRVTIAALVHQPGKTRPLHRDLLLGIVQGLDDLLARGIPNPEARQTWASAETRMQADWARRYRHTLIFAIVMLVIVFGCLGGLTAIVLAWKPR